MIYIISYHFEDDERDYLVKAFRSLKQAEMFLDLEIAKEQFFNSLKRTKRIYAISAIELDENDQI